MSTKKVLSKTIQAALVGVSFIAMWDSAIAADTYDYASVCPKNGYNNSGGKADVWGMYQCECVSYVADKINELGVPFKNAQPSIYSVPNGNYKTDRWSNAEYWADKARSLGISVSTTPTINSVAWWKKSSSSPVGHVAWVESVNADGTVNISEYNAGYPKNPYKYQTRNNVRADAYIQFKKPVSTMPVPVTLTSLALSCPSSVNENSTGVCSAKAYYSNGTSKSVNPSWGDNSSALSVNSSGNISTGSVSSDTSVKITGGYSESGKYVENSATVVVKDIPDWTGKNPNGTVCEKDGQTVASKAGKYGTLELRWSNTCKVNWVRMTSKSSSYSTEVKVQRSSDGRTYTNSGKGSIWTSMVYAPNITVCASGKVNGESISGVCR